MDQPDDQDIGDVEEQGESAVEIEPDTANDDGQDLEDAEKLEEVDDETAQ
jgi:hypothetical protein